jgi:hypothetical protein
MRHKICLISILFQRSCAIDRIHEVGMDQAASQGHICVSSAQSLVPLGL